MNRSGIILRNIASNWVGFAVNAAVTLVLTPFVLRELGQARYGIWILTSSIIGYYGLLDMGFRAGVTQYLTRHLATGDYEKGSECVSTAVTALAVLGVLLVVLSIGVAYVAPRLFRLPPGVESEAFWCILIVGLASAIGCVFYPFAAIFTATQRYDLASLIGVGTRFLTAWGIFFALKMQYGLIGVSAATCGVSLIDHVIRWRVGYRLVSGLRVSWRRINWRSFRETGSFGAWNFLISLSSYVYQHLPNLLIGSFMPVAAVGHYALANGLSQQINAALSPAGQVFYPAATALHAQGDRGGLERLYHHASRLMMLVMIPVVLVAAFWATDFYRLWIGEKYLTGAPFHSVALLLQILLIRTVTYYTSNIAGQILLGAGQVRPLATVSIFGTVLLNATGALILIGPYGLVGVAVSIAIAGVVMDLAIIPLMLQRILGLSVKQFIRVACVRPLVAGALQTVLMGCIRLIGQPYDWSALLFQGILAGVGSAAIALGVGLTTDERHRYIVRPMRQRLQGKAMSV